MNEKELDQRADEVVAHIYAAYGTDSGYVFGLPPGERNTVRAIVKVAFREAERRGWMGPKEAQDGQLENG